MLSSNLTFGWFLGSRRAAGARHVAPAWLFQGSSLLHCSIRQENGAVIPPFPSPDPSLIPTLFHISSRSGVSTTHGTSPKEQKVPLAAIIRANASSATPRCAETFSRRTCLRSFNNCLRAYCCCESNKQFGSGTWKAVKPPEMIELSGLHTGFSGLCWKLWQHRAHCDLPVIPGTFTKSLFC